MTDVPYNPALAYPVRTGIVGWFIAVHALATLALLYLVFVHFDSRTVLMAVGLFFACHLSITMGMHRLYAHRAYEASTLLQLILLALSASAFQSSAIWWAAYHRLHHAHADTERDPYGILHGFLWAHIKWAVRAPDEVPKSAKELAKNKLVTFQHRYYFPLAIVFGLVLPTALGAWWGDALGGLLVGGFLRLVLQYHLTWVINSVSHSFGHRRYKPVGTARTNGWLLALLTVGESFHERHHLAPDDYRLGNRWYDWDIGKWFIRFFWMLGLARKLKTVPEDTVTARADMLTG